jgi:hypothetical protein
MFAFCYYNFIHDSSFCNLSEKEYSSSKWERIKPDSKICAE